LLQRLFHYFIPQHNNDYACVIKSLQLRVSLRFSAPRYEVYCKIWVKRGKRKKEEQDKIIPCIIEEAGFHQKNERPGRD
jgi:hypothetical protein